MPKRAEDSGASVVAARLRAGTEALAEKAARASAPTESGGGVATAPAPAARESKPAPRPKPVARPRPTNESAGRKFTKMVKFSLTTEDKEAMDDLVRLIAQKVGGGRSSHVIRALWSVLQQSEEAIEAMPPLANKLSTPDNNDYPAIAEFEEELAHFLARAINRSNPS